MLANQPSLSAHDKAALPTRKQRHFFYRADTPALDACDMAVVTDSVATLIEERGLGVAQIEVFTLKYFREHAAAAVQDSLDRLTKTLGLDAVRDRTSLLTCEWASPHEDSAFEGKAFVSVVLGTGPYSYVMNMFHSRKLPGKTGLDLVTSTRVLRTGEVIVFDPTIPHMAAPGRPSTDSLLVMLQVEVDISEPGGMEALLRRFPRHASDADQASVFDPFLGSLD